MTKKIYKSTLGEIIEYPQPPSNVAAFLRRVEEAAEDPRVSENDLIDLVYGTENPLLEQGRFKDRGAVTKETIANPLWRVFLDLLQHKRIALGKTTRERLEATFSMTVAEAAELLGITPDGVLRAIRAKKLTALKKPNGYLVDPRSVDSYRETRKHRGTTKGPALRVAFGNLPGHGFRVKFEGMRLGESGSIKDGKLRFGEVDSFKRGAFMISGKEMHRTFILEPAARKHRYSWPKEDGPFYIEGLFKIVEKVNNASAASKAFRAFQPE